jgi:hypothetical protein
MCKVENLLRSAITWKSEVNQGERVTAPHASRNHPINMKVKKWWGNRVG